MAGEEVRPFPFGAARRSFTGVTLANQRIRIKYLRRPDGELLSEVWFGPDSEGAPGLVHGGAVLTVLDEAMGAACWIRGLPVLTARLNAVFRRGVPLETPLTAETAVGRTRGRLSSMAGRLVGADGTLFAEAEGSFIRLTDAQMKERFGQTVTGL